MAFRYAIANGFISGRFIVTNAFRNAPKRRPRLAVNAV